MLGVAEADLQLERGFVRMKGARGMPQNLSPSLWTRTIGVPGLHDGAWSRRARPGCAELTADGGPRVRIHLPPAASLRTISSAVGRIGPLPLQAHPQEWEPALADRGLNRRLSILASESDLPGAGRSRRRRALRKVAEQRRERLSNKGGTGSESL
jgi:hypothetical protein